MGIREALAEVEEKIVFNKEKHTYKYEDKTLTSVTSILKPYFPFDAETVAAGLSESTNPKYAGKSVKEIMQMWTDKADAGTDVHAMCEAYLKGEFFTIENEIMQSAYNYLSKFHFEDVICEAKVAAPEWGIAGTIDALVKIKGKWYIYDWKTDSAIRMKGFKKKGDDGLCSGVLTGFENCNHTKFSFQLGIYRLILETFYDIPISGMVVVHFEPSRASEYVLPYHLEYIGLVLSQAQVSK